MTTSTPSMVWVKDFVPSVSIVVVNVVSLEASLVNTIIVPFVCSVDSVKFPSLSGNEILVTISATPLLEVIL